MSRMTDYLKSISSLKAIDDAIELSAICSVVMLGITFVTIELYDYFHDSKDKNVQKGKKSADSVKYNNEKFYMKGGRGMNCANCAYWEVWKGRGYCNYWRRFVTCDDSCSKCS